MREEREGRMNIREENARSYLLTTLILGNVVRARS